MIASFKSSPGGARVRSWLVALILLSFLTALPGCDVILGVYLATRKSSSKSSSAPSTPPAPDPRYFVYGATLTAGTETTELNSVKGAGGNPGLNWSLLGGGTATADFALSGGMNAVLIQATTVQAYDIDAVEGHDAADHVVSTFTTTNFADQVTNTSNIAGFPDGLPANAQASATQKAFIFQILPASATAVVSVRVFIVANPGTRASGDVDWVTPWTRGGDQIPGGCGANSAGTVFFGATDAGTQAQWLLAVDANGNLQIGGSAILGLESGTAVSVGNISVAVDTADHVIVANVTTNNITGGSSTHSGIRWRKLSPGTALPPAWSTPIWDQGFSGAGINLVGSNGVAVDNIGNVLIAGGNDVGTVTSRNGRWFQKVDGVGGGVVWNQTGPADLNSTWWRGLAIGPGDSVATTGDITTGVTGPVEVFTRTTNTGNTTTSDATYSESGTQADLGEAVAVDGSGNTYVSGFLGISGPSKNAVILKIPSGSTTPAQWFLETTNAPSEILGLLSLSDGTLYAVGYEAVSAQSPVSAQSQGNNIVVMKIGPAGNVLWKRTYDSGQGDDQAVSATLTSTALVVVGQVSTASNGKDVFIISYVR
jgi:hypothetical protein